VFSPSFLRLSAIFIGFFRESGKRGNNESGTQELRKGWHFLQAFPKNRISWADCRMKSPSS
jgi:hypothetical protein